MSIKSIEKIKSCDTDEFTRCPVLRPASIATHHPLAHAGGGVHGSPIAGGSRVTSVRKRFITVIGARASQVSAGDGRDRTPR
ncbi:hypothetical protein CHELA41_23973 [Hyphomicrobiales bacterium]|nr:hypothetical protein CHELA41_23973 [Hyphomicrobiales bacterium]